MMARRVPSLFENLASQPALPIGSDAELRITDDATLWQLSNNPTRSEER
jgi:hypothetical protein